MIVALEVSVPDILGSVTLRSRAVRLSPPAVVSSVGCVNWQPQAGVDMKKNGLLAALGARLVLEL